MTFLAILILLFAQQGTVSSILQQKYTASNDTISISTIVSTDSLNLEKGDIVWRFVDENIFPLFQYFMHPLMFTGNIIDDKYEFIEAHGGKDVCLTLYSEFTIKNDGLFRVALRLNQHIPDRQTVIDNAVSFATMPDRLDDEFVSLVYFDEDGYLQYHYKNSNPDDPNDPLSDKWYCTELIWAAYKNQGIELDGNDGPVLPMDLFASINLYTIDLWE